MYSEHYRVTKLRFETISTGIEATVFLNPGERIVNIETINGHRRLVHIEKQDQWAAEKDAEKRIRRSEPKPGKYQ